MHILYIHQHFSTLNGSTGTRSYEFAKRMLARGHQVTVLCGTHQLSKNNLDHQDRKGIRKGIIDGINVIEIHIPYSNHDNISERLAKFIRFSWAATYYALTLRYDLILCTSTPLTVAIPGILAKICKKRIKFVFEVRDLWPDLPIVMKQLKNPLLIAIAKLLEKKAYRKADLCIGLAPGIKKSIEQYKPAEKVKMIPNASDVDLFSPTDPSTKEIPIPGCKEDDFIAIFTGAHGLANGLEIILQVAQELKKQGAQGIKFVLIGDGKCKPSLLAQYECLELDNCIFIDPIPKNQLIAYYRQANLGLMLLRNIPDFYYSTSPNKFFDYIAAKLPVLCNYPGWVSDLITEHACGVCVPPDNPVIFAQTLISLKAQSPQVLKKMSEKSFKIADELFNRDLLAHQFINHIENIS